MTISRVFAMPRMLDWSIRIDRAPALLWIGCIAAALLPAWAWMARVADGPDDPLGAIAIAALALILWRHRRRLRVAPRLGWLALAAAGTLASTIAIGLVPPLAVSLVALASFGAVLAAFLPSIVPTAPVVALALMSPAIALLHDHAGAALHIFDVAPGSGMPMPWLGMFTACVVAAWTFRPSRSFLARLPLAGLCVLAGTIARDTVRAALETSGQVASGAVQEAVGPAVLALVCGAIAWLMVDEGARHV